MKAKDFLKQVSKLDKMINNKMLEVEQWKSIACRSTGSIAGEKVKSSGSPQKMADAVNRYVSIQQEIDQDIDRLVNMKQDVIREIEKLPVTEYDILHQFYIQGKSFTEIADDYKCSYSNITTIHGRAIKHLNDILSGGKEDDQKTDQ